MEGLCDGISSPGLIEEGRAVAVEEEVARRLVAVLSGVENA
jgi:hypothetical protein